MENEGLNTLKNDLEIKGNDNRYFAACDEKKVDDLESAGYNLENYPHPFWGNIEDPSIIVLSLNPSSTEADKEEAKKLEKKFDNENQFHQLNWLKNDISDEKDKTSTINWWRSVFFEDESKELFGTKYSDEIGKNAAFFNLCCYHKTKDAKFDYALPSTKRVCQYINSLSSDIPVIVLWGYPKWKDAFNKYELFHFFDNRKVLVVNAFNPFNCQIFNTHRCERPLWENQKEYEEKWKNIYDEIKDIFINGKDSQYWINKKGCK